MNKKEYKEAYLKSIKKISFLTVDLKDKYYCQALDAMTILEKEMIEKKVYSKKELCQIYESFLEEKKNLSEKYQTVLFNHIVLINHKKELIEMSKNIIKNNPKTHAQIIKDHTKFPLIVCDQKGFFVFSPVSKEALKTLKKEKIDDYEFITFENLKKEKRLRK